MGGGGDERFCEQLRTLTEVLFAIGTFPTTTWSVAMHEMNLYTIENDCLQVRTFQVFEGRWEEGGTGGREGGKGRGGEGRGGEGREGGWVGVWVNSSCGRCL